MTIDYRHFIMSTIAYAASKGYKYWPRVIKNLEDLEEKLWKTPRPNKNRYVLKCVTKIKCEGGNDILKQEQVVTDCELEMELEDTYNNKLHQGLGPIQESSLL